MLQRIGNGTDLESNLRNRRTNCQSVLQKMAPLTDIYSHLCSFENLYLAYRLGEF
jgi:hypothetical protein